MLRRGDRTFLPLDLRKAVESPVDIITSSLRFAGYQVGYAAWGFGIIFFLLFVVFFIIGSQIAYAIRFRQNTLLLMILHAFWPALLVALFVLIAQRLIASCCFLTDQDVLAINNRRAFHIVSYCMFYFNIFIGLFSCLLRIFLGIIFGMIFLLRLQRSTLSLQFEIRDTGYMSYIGYLLLEHQHSNLVLQCFSQLLSSRKAQRARKKSDIHALERDNKVRLAMNLVNEPEELNAIQKVNMSKKRARTRWHLFTLLIQNPSLRRFRKHNRIEKPAGRKKKSLKQSDILEAVVIAGAASVQDATVMGGIESFGAGIADAFMAI